MRAVKDEATRMARQAFDAAVADLDKLDPDNFLDASGILQLLRDNLALWTAPNQPDLDPSLSSNRRLGDNP